MFKVNNRNTRTRCEICSKLTIKTYLTSFFSVSIVNFEQINAGRAGLLNKVSKFCLFYFQPIFPFYTTESRKPLVFWCFQGMTDSGGGGGTGAGGQKVTISLKWINLMSLGFIYEILFIEFIYVNYFWDEQVLKNMLINFRTFPPFFIWLPFLSSFSRWVSLSKCFYCKYYYYYYRTIKMSF